jgi:transcriptional regulator with XRE-family HTH domain
LPKLAELGLLPDGSHDILSTSPTAAVRYTGRWLRRERKKRGMLHIAIAPALHVACASLEVIEARDWPLPPEWLPILRRLGLMESAEAAARLAQATPSPETAPSDATPKVPRQRSARATRSSNRMLAAKSQGTLEGKSLTGVWLRQVRLKRSITQRWLSEQLNVNQTKLWRCESENQPLPPGWLPILSRLGWLAPSTSKAAPSTAVSPAALTKPARKKTVRAAAGPVIDGRWLKAERHRLKLSRRTIEDELHTSHQQYRRFEGGHALLPRSWWQGLRKLRVHLPDSFPQPATPATPLVGPPNGAWLALERKRLALTEYEVVHALRINALQLRRVERESDELPKAWLAKLPLLGIAVETTTARRGQARKATLAATAPASPARPSKPRKQAATAAPTNDSGPATVPPPTPAAGEGADLAALIVHYRVSFGRRAKQPAFEILRRILTDLSESGLDATITDEDVERAAQVLIRRR